MFCKSANLETLTRTSEGMNSPPKDKTIVGTKEECFDIKNRYSFCLKNDKINFFSRVFNKLNNEIILTVSGNCNGSDLAFNYGQKYLTPDQAEEMMENAINGQLGHCQSKLNSFIPKNNSEPEDPAEDQILKKKY